MTSNSLVESYKLQNRQIETVHIISFLNVVKLHKSLSSVKKLFFSEKSLTTAAKKEEEESLMTKKNFFHLCRRPRKLFLWTTLVTDVHKGDLLDPIYRQNLLWPKKQKLTKVLLAFLTNTTS